jgi:hypothetical protein
MKTFLLGFIYISLMFLLTGCAATYRPPVPINTSASANIQASKTAIFQTARRVLVSEGFQITNADESSGTISTAFRNYRLSPTEADCGRTMGLDYLKDKRTTTRVSYSVIVDEQLVTVKANVEGEYKPGAVDQDITLTCNSRGQLEQSLLRSIKMASGYQKQ